MLVRPHFVLHFALEDNSSGGTLCSERFGFGDWCGACASQSRSRQHKTFDALLFVAGAPDTPSPLGLIPRPSRSHRSQYWWLVVLTKPLVMHQVLLIDEILEVLLDQCAEWSSLDYRLALCQIARTCQAWKDPATDRLWSRLENTRPILRLLAQTIDDNEVS